jgi:hypothetical protein
MANRRLLLVCILLGQLLTACERRSSSPQEPTELITFSEEAAKSAGDNRLIIGRGEDYQPINEPPDKLFAEMRDSMLQRRQRAWQIVENIIRPVTLAAGEGRLQLPRWQTWYESEQDIREMMVAYFEKLKATPTADRQQLVEQVFQEYTERDLAERLKDENFRQRLKQFEGSPELTAGLNGQGFTIFSPSFLRHMMLEAQGTEACPFDVPAHARPETLPLPASAMNFSSCIAEFPRSAVMVKTTWRPLETGLIQRGTWPRPARRAMPAPNSVYTLTSDTGERMALTGIHFVTKDVREWVWVTLWWDPQPNDDFGSDRPASIAQYNNGVWANYKMCATGSFEEGDRAPWSHFTDPSLSAALRGVHTEMDALVQRTSKNWPAVWNAIPRLSKQTTWCSNPNLETHSGNGRTNCIGCHQYPNTFNEAKGEVTRFDDTLAVGDRVSDFPQDGRAQYRENFPAEFAWSFPVEFKGIIEQARRAARFEWPVTK